MGITAEAETRTTPSKDTISSLFYNYDWKVFDKKNLTYSVFANDMYGYSMYL